MVIYISLQNVILKLILQKLIYSLGILVYEHFVSGRYILQRSVSTVNRLYRFTQIQIRYSHYTTTSSRLIPVGRYVSHHPTHHQPILLCRYMVFLFESSDVHVRRGDCVWTSGQLDPDIYPLGSIQQSVSRDRLDSTMRCGPLSDRLCH